MIFYLVIFSRHLYSTQLERENQTKQTEGCLPEDNMSIQFLWLILAQIFKNQCNIRTTNQRL